MTPNDFSDELFESMASSAAQTPASQQLRNAVLAQTTRTVRNRRRMRHARLAATLVACYLGGMATMSLSSTGPPASQLARDSNAGSVQNADRAAEPEPQRLVRPEDDQVADSSLPQSKPLLTPYERLCRTGDQQLEKQDDIQGAMRSYKKALQLASADQRSIAPDRDTWLLMALKQSIN
jgi:hypothetical protein